MKRLLAALILGALACAAVFLGLRWAYQDRTLPMAVSELTIEIERGASGAAVAQALRKQGVGVSETEFLLALRWRGDAAQIRAGNYALTTPLSLQGLLDRLTRGNVAFFDWTLVEGWTFRQVRASLQKQPHLARDTAGLSDEALLARIGATETHPEGLFAPDTYAYVRGSSDLELLRRAYRLQQQRIAAAWEGRMSATAPLPYRSPYDALILASIIERETGREEDRTRVAAVFINRLRKGMMLQSDPTTIYGLGEAFDGNLRRRDLTTDTPYNTYTRHGLTPTPIAMPGRASIEAAFKPAPIDALYFVARGDGSSEFSSDLAAHNRAVNRYQRGGSP